MAAIYSNSKALILLLVITLTLTIPARSDFLHDVLLVVFKLPPGLFPQQVGNCTLTGNGALEININNSPCIYRVNTAAAVDFLYGERVQGRISEAQIVRLNGMNMKTNVSTANWRNVTSIRVPNETSETSLIFTFSDGGSFNTDTGYFQIIPSCTPLEVGVLGEENLHDTVDELARPWSGVSRKALI